MPKSVTTTPDTAIDNADDIDQMRIAASAASALLKGVAHEDRLLLLCLLSRHELSVGEIEAQLHIHQPSLSQQLGVLRREKLVATRREGKRIFYRIADQKALALLTLLYDLYCRVDH
ncbi:MAG: metalloregulator ArsR/SmtB family transcription factor [Porticoccus sp.]|jgi:ArsR family transcriptional regulator|uniref:metalloregulator ArsR/SmtB family transcription factor n=1 Tax=Porticoccus sp. TaxID=2024853 RepID=UPI0032971126